LTLRPRKRTVFLIFDDPVFAHHTSHQQPESIDMVKRASASGNPHKKRGNMGRETMGPGRMALLAALCALPLASPRAASIAGESPATVANVNALNLTGIVGELAVYDNTGLAGPQMDAGDVYTNVFSTAVRSPINGYALNDDGAGIVMSAGRHLVLYNTRINNVGGGSRVNSIANLSLTSGGTTEDLAYGLSHGYIRYANGADESILSGGAVIEAGGGDILRLVTRRTDTNTGRLSVPPAGQTAIQLLKLDDDLDTLRLSRSNNVSAALNTYSNVTYNQIDEASFGATVFTNGSGSVTLNDDGHFLVLANTTVDRAGLSTNGTRISFTQRLLLDGTEVTGSKTTTYIRGEVDADGCLDGVAAIGMIVEAVGRPALQVQLKQEGTQVADIDGARTGLTIVKLPDTARFIKLEDTRGQDLNQATNTPVTFDTQNGTPDAVFFHDAASTSSVVTVNRDGRYLFLGAFYCDQDTVDRQSVHQQWTVNGALTGYGQSSRYSRNDVVFDNGNWSGLLVDLDTADEVEMTSVRLAADGVLPGHSVGLQGVDIVSLTTNPVLLVNGRLEITAGTTKTIGSDLLRAAALDTAAADLVYSVGSHINGGTLRRDGAGLELGDAFTQADIDAGKLTFTAGVTSGEAFGFAFTVEDLESDYVSSHFAIKVAEAIVVGGDNGDTDEDTLIAALTGGETNVLANDTGEALVVTAHDALSAGRATVVVNADGTFSYDPESEFALQRLGNGDATNDTFTYTVTDAIGAVATGTVTIAVSGVEDAFAAVDNYVDDLGNRVYETVGMSLTVDLTANDGIVRTANGTTNDILVLNYDATASPGLGRWENLGSLGGSRMDWLLSSGVTLGDVTSARTGIATAYTWDGTPSAVALLNAGGESVHDILGDGTIDKDSASFEFWVKPAAAGLTQNMTLFETGGGAGVGIVIGSNGVLRAANNILEGEVTYDLVADSQGLVGGDPTTEFLQIVFVTDYDNDLSSLYVNGTLVDTAANAGTDWDGGDNAGLGHFQGSNHGGFQNTAAGTVYDTYFNGAMAVFRVYSEALSSADVFQNYQAIDQGGVDMEGDTLAVSGIYDTNTNLVPGTGTPVALPSGAVVTLDDAVGGFSYNPTGIVGLAELAFGEMVNDTFDIRVTDGNGQTDDATVLVAVHGVNSAADDTLEAKELFVTTFEASELVGNDEHSVGTAGPLVNLQAAAVTASNVVDGVWVNRGTGGATYDGTVNGGRLVTPVSGFGSLGAAWRDPRIALAALDAISTADATFEIWFKPQFGSGGKQSLLEGGGNGNGMSIVYDADENRVVCAIDGGVDTDPDQYLLAETGGISYEEFNQVVMVYDKDNPGTTDGLAVYVNNDPTAFDATPDGIATNATAADDFAGADLGGIGTVSGTAALNDALVGFRGQVTALYVYSRALAVTEIEDNFIAALQPIQALPPGSPVTTALGAVVTLNADGSVSYDATSLSTNIPAGTVVQDGFTYTIADGIGGASAGTVTINVMGLGNFYALDDDEPVGEDGPAHTFDPRTNDVGASGATIALQTTVAGYRADYRDGTAQGQLADFSATNGWRYMWNAPADWDGTNSSDGTTGPLGNSADYELLVWNATGSPRWCPDGDNDNLNGKPGNYLRLTAVGGHPGRGSGQNEGITNNLDRAAVAAYTVAEAGYYAIVDSVLHKISTANNSISAVVYVEDTLISAVSAAPGIATPFDMELGQVDAGETIYVAVSPDSQDGNDGFEWDFSIAELPGSGSGVLDTIGTVTTDGSTVTYDPNGQFESLPVGASVHESFQHTVRDGSNVSHATVTMEIRGVNDAPTGVADASATDEESTVAGALLGNDTDVDQGDELGLVVAEVQGATGNVAVAVAADRGGRVTVQADGSYVYDPNGQFESLGVWDTAPDTFTYLVEDAQALAAAAAATVTVTITGTDDGVIATDNDYALRADTTVSGNVISDDTGDGVDVSLDTNDDLFIQSVTATNLQGLLTISEPVFVGTRGTISNLTDAIRTVTFDTVGGRFSNAVVFANPPSYNDTEPTVVMVSNVTATTFDIRLKEQPEGGAADDADGATHAVESVSWFVLEAGRHRLANGALMEVGTVDTAAIRHQGTGGSSWQDVTFSAPFTTNPAVFTQIQTLNGNTNENRELFGTRMNGLATTNGFQVALEDHQGDSAARATLETIGWVAIEPGTGMWGDYPVVVGITPSQTGVVNQNMYTVQFGIDFGNAPDFIASQATIAGGDPTQVRFQNLDADSVQVRASEDTFFDTEMDHADERITYLAVGGSGDLSAYPADLPIGGFMYDPNGAFDTLRRGQVGTEVFTYTLTDGRGNTDTKTVTITVKDIRDGLLIIVR